MQTNQVNTLLHELEIQKKKMDLMALNSLQDYLKQLISFSLIQEDIKNNSRLLAQPLSAHPSLSRAMSITTQGGQSPPVKMPEQIPLLKQSENRSAIAKKAANFQVKMEEEPTQASQMKIETEESDELNRKSDTESGNSSQNEKITSLCQPLFSLFPQRKKNLICPHPWRRHHAKNLCKKCYEKFGRTKKPTNCDHEVHFARGYCRKCYFRTFKRNSRYDPQVYDELKVKLNGIKKRL